MRRNQKPLRGRLACVRAQRKTNLDQTRKCKIRFTNNVVWKIPLRSRAPYGFVRNLGRYNLAVNQDKLVARTSFTASAPNSAQETRNGETQHCQTVNMLTVRTSQYADS